jgi:anti-sigma B factor antagonist
MILEMKETGKILAAKITQQEANLNNADQFKKEMFALIDHGYRVIALNFEEVTYVDSSFLGAMVSSLKHALSLGTEIYLTDLKKDIIDLLRLIRMDRVFKIYGSVNDVESVI